MIWGQERLDINTVMPSETYRCWPDCTHTSEFQTAVDSGMVHDPPRSYILEVGPEGVLDPKEAFTEHMESKVIRYSGSQGLKIHTRRTCQVHIGLSSCPFNRKGDVDDRFPRDNPVGCSKRR